MKESFETPNNNSETRAIRGVENPQFFESLPRADVVIVPGAELKWTPGESEAQRDLYPEQQVRAGIETKMRAIAAFELLRNSVVDKIIFTGGVMENEPYGVSLADASHAFVLQLLHKHNEAAPESAQLSESRILTAADSKNTAEDVEEGLKIARQEQARSAYIETTGFHVPRAMITAKHLAATYTISEGLYGIAAEDILRARSSHYEDLLGYFEPPESIRRNPSLAIKKGTREFIRRFIMRSLDPNDEIGRREARKERTHPDKQNQ